MEYYITNNPRRPIEMIMGDEVYYYSITEDLWIEYHILGPEIEEIRKQTKASKIDLLLYGINNE